MSRVAVVAAGGTGGHMFPAEALARALAGRGWRVVLATDSRGDRYAQHFPAEERLALEAATFKTNDPIGALRGFFRIWAGARAAKAAFRRLKPAVVVGFGGYPSLPALLAARSMRIPTAIHEQNAVLGRVNRYLAPKVNAVACAFPTLIKATPAVKASAVVVGNPVRPAIQALYDRPYEQPDIEIRLLITGGSQGARLLSEMVPRAIALLPEDMLPRLKVVQQTREESLEFARETYHDAGVEAEISPFFRDMASKLSEAHLVIGRAGASTCCELAVASLPSILVPLAIAADDHQRFNAKLLEDAGGAIVAPETQLTAVGLCEILTGLATHPERLAIMARGARSVASPDAAERLADLVEKVAG